MTSLSRAGILAKAALPALFLLALFVFELPVLRSRSGAANSPSAMLDGESSWHARRITLGRVTTRFPQSERMLMHPGSTAYADPPLFDAALALLAGGALGRNAGGAAEGPPDEQALEGFLTQIGPTLLFCLLAGLAFAARGDGGRRWIAAVLSVGLVALSPQAWSACSAGRIEPAALAALFLVMQVGLVRAAWTTEDALDRLQAGLLAGLVTGVGLASTPLFAGAALGAWGGFLLDACSAQGSAARDRARAGLLFSVGAILPAQLPAMDGPWRAVEAGPVAEWSTLASGFLLLGSLAFALPFFSKRELPWLPRAVRGLIAAAVLGLIGLVLFAPGGEGLARPLRAALRVDVLPGEPAFTTLLQRAAPVAALVGLALWLAALAALARPLRAALVAPERVYYAAAITGGALAAAFYEPAGILFLAVAAAAVACVIGRGLPLSRAGVALLAGAALYGGVGLLLSVRQDAERRAEAAEAVMALRWVRENSEPASAWMAAGAVGDYGVLAEPALAGLVAYHARRPGYEPGARACAAPAAQARVRELLATDDLDGLARAAGDLGARYLVTEEGGPLQARLAGAPVRGLERVYPPDGEGSRVLVYRFEEPLPRGPGEAIYWSK